MLAIAALARADDNGSTAAMVQKIVSGDRLRNPNDATCQNPELVCDLVPACGSKGTSSACIRSWHPAWKSPHSWVIGGVPNWQRWLSPLVRR